MLRALLLTFLLACTGSDKEATDKADKLPEDKPAQDAPAQDVTLPQVTYKWDPSVGDASVSAELGGPGFTGEGWETNLTYPSIGVASAPQGGTMTQGLEDWPATLRMAGQNWNTYFNYMVVQLCYEGLLELNPVTLDYNPRLATHWQISEDRSTYRFRINPAARWSDGTEVTSADVVATWKLRTDPTILEPSSVSTYSKVKEPRAISKYIVEIQVEEESWRNFLSISTMAILPAHQISIPGGEYLDKYQFHYTAVSGPYVVNEADIVTGQTITITRRKDWWAEENPAYDGLYNIGAFKFVVVKDPNLAFEKLKKGEIDYYDIPKAQWWAEDVPALDTVKRGLVIPRKIYNDTPVGTDGIAINMTRPPLDDVRIRKALQLLYDRQTMIEKLYFNEYKPLNSYWQGGVYQNPNNEMFGYDEVGAVELLEQAGWTEINPEGYRMKGGEELKFTVTYRSQLSERGLTLFQEAAKRAGIRVELQLLTPAAGWKNLQEKEYELMSTAWGAVIFPNPRSSWHSELARDKNNNNVTAFADPRVDALCEAYDREYDVQKRAAIVREIDGLVYSQHPYVMGWYKPALRVVFWNKFGMPAWGAGRFQDETEMPMIWWVDPQKEQELAAAQADAAKTMDPGPKEVRFWEAWNKAQPAAPAPGTSSSPGLPDAPGAAAPADNAPADDAPAGAPAGGAGSGGQ